MHEWSCKSFAIKSMSICIELEQIIEVLFNYSTFGNYFRFAICNNYMLGMQKISVYAIGHAMVSHLKVTA